MHVTTEHKRLELPESLRTQLFQFRARLWAIKLAEGACGAIFGVLAAFLVMFFLDRIGNTPSGIRLGIFGFAVLACSLIPIVLHRWVWRRRQLEQLASLLGRIYPSIGDQILGIIELARSDSEQARSLSLCAAAIEQVAGQAQTKDFAAAVPHPKHVRLSVMATSILVIGGTICVLYPAAAQNAWARMLLPWGSTPRYTFTKVVALPNTLVVPHGESFTLNIGLAEDTVSRPSEGAVHFKGQTPVVTQRDDDQYQFALAPLLDSRLLEIRIGDYSSKLLLKPTLRPELSSLIADVSLPAYLQRPAGISKDARSGTVSVVNGSQATFVATATRPLISARFDGVDVVPDGDKIVSRATSVEGESDVQLEWQDELGLAGREPFTLMIRGHEDEAPSIACADLPRRKIVLDSEQLSFHVTAQDDFGVKQVGVEWQGFDEMNYETPAKGERLLAAGGPDKELVELVGTFAANSLGIEPQPIQLRLFADDYLESRERVYSAPYLLYVLNEEQHAIWLTEQLSKWHRQSLDVRDRELQLYETNRRLHALTVDEIDDPATRQQIDSQASAERANGRRLNRLVQSGEDLVKQAMRNPQFGVGHLESWAGMLQVLKEISGNRMPSVADLLKQASQAPKMAASAASNSAPQVGQVRAAPSGGGSSEEKEDETSEESPQVPSIVDLESTQQPLEEEQESSDQPPSPPGTSRLSLATTTLLGAGGEKAESSPVNEKLEEAVEQQQDLLAEFEKIADELNRLLANLEGSTLVKRLKAASRLQYRIAGRLGEHVESTFGVSLNVTPDAQREMLLELSAQEVASSHDLSNIMDDMQAYFERRRFLQFKTVLDEMRREDVIGSLRQLADTVQKKTGLSMAQCEYWSDTLDRWAEDLVEPTSGEADPGSKSAGSLPPSLVLEALQILEAEVNLREETRVTEQAKPVEDPELYGERSGALSETQEVLTARVDELVASIQELPDPGQFGREIELLTTVSEVMQEASQILARPETGSPAIAAETHAIELLLESKRINPNGGGGGGGTQPGGGGTGTTTDSAMSLVGSGINAQEVTEDHGVSQSTGETGKVLPEEFRAGLDEYFNRLEESNPSR